MSSDARLPLAVPGSGNASASRVGAFRFSVVNLGCKVNRVEADGFERLLAARGGEPSREAEADLIVVNTCTVTGEAEKKTRKAVRHALNANVSARVVVTGCATEIDAPTYQAMSGRVTVVPKAEAALFLAEQFRPAPFCDAGSALLSQASASASPRQKGQGFPLTGEVERASGLTNGKALGGSDGVLPLDGRTRVGVKVQDGCDNACTYCIVHVARGRATSRPADEVVAESVALARSGVREIVLTGINLGSYNSDGTDLAELCRRLLAATADIHAPGEPPCRFRVGSVEPMDVSEGFIAVLAAAQGRPCRQPPLP